VLLVRVSGFVPGEDAMIGLSYWSRNPRVVEVIQTWEKRGTGTPDSPHRFILTIWTKDGEWLAEERDQYAGEKGKHDSTSAEEPTRD